MTDAERALRGEIARTCLAMGDKRINQGTSGNVSVRWGEGLLITPSGLAYETMAPEDIIYLEMDGTAHGPHAPSSEWRFHRDIMRERPDLNAIVHAHPAYCTGVSILNEDIPAVHYMIAAAGGSTVRCAPYATYGTEELSKNALAALEGRNACLLANHGLIACGPSLPKALWLAVEMETLAQQYVIAKSAGDPVVLSDTEIGVVIEKFKSYGPRRKDEAAAEPAKTAKPVRGAKPAKAAAPARAAKTAEPLKAATSTVTAAPAKAAKPAKSSAPAKAAKTAKAAEPAKATKPAKAVEPAKAAKPTKAAAPARAAKSTKAAEPAKAVKSAKAAEPAKAAKPAKAAEPAKAAKTAKAAEPEKAATPTKAAETAKPAKSSPRRRAAARRATGTTRRAKG